MLKGIKKAEGFFLGLLLIFALFVRFIDYPNRLIFGPEQSMSLITTGEMIKDKFTLLGEPYIQRTTSTGLYLFHSAVFNYSLIPLEILFNYDPFYITVFFTFLNIFTGILLYHFIKKASNSKVAWFSTFLFLLNSKMIHHSLFIWSLNYLPLIGLLSLFLMWKLIKNKNGLLPIFILGLLSGIGFGLQYVYAISAFVIFLFILFVSKRKLTGSAVYFIGAAFGDLPMISFDIKHSFYHLNSLHMYFLDLQAGRISGFYTYYQFLNLWPLFAIIGGVLLYQLFIRNKLIVYALLIGYLFFNLVSPYSKLIAGKITANDITITDLTRMANIIAKDNPPKIFNIAVLLDFDTQAHPLRYVLTFKHNLKPQPVEKYANLDAMYVLALQDYDMKLPRVWELQTYLPYKITLIDSLTENHRLYKLTK